MLDVEWLDIKLFYLINNGTQNRAFDILMPWVTNRNNWWPLIGAIVVYLLVFGKRKGRVAILVVGVAVGLSDFTASSVIKPMLDRIRPCHILEGVNLLVNCTKSYSFPSSHAANIFALAVAGSYYYRSAIAPLFILAIVIGYSRVYVGVHYPFDVLGGYVWGGLIAVVVVWMERKIINVRRET
ncbi:MAG: phosphatase PAP2 family protein [Deltaproteobacteria bacterium]|nr:phosphatase PAP2 family protein [Deltaproteobacteria bacterium]